MVKTITIIKLLPLLGIIVFGVGHINSSNLQWQHLPSVKTFSDTTLILFFAFAGFETSLGVSGEIKNTRRTVPVSICIAGIVILIIYLLLQTVVQGVLGNELPLYKDAPIAAIAEKIVGHNGATIILLCTALSSFGNVTLDILCTPRALFAGANDGMFPKFLNKVHPKFATPYIAIILYGSFIFIFSIAGGFQQLAIMASATILLIYLAVVFATVKLRTKKTEGQQTYFKAPGGLITPAIATAAIIWLLTSLRKWEVLSTLLFIIVITGFYFITKWLKQKKEVAETG
jgi:amino acid transporter